MGDGEACLAVHQMVDGVLYQLLRTRINGRSCFIENEKRFSDYESTGNGQQLFLTGGEVCIILQYGVIALRQGADEVINAHNPAGFFYFFLTDAGAAIGDVVADGVFKGPWVLKNHRKHAVNVGTGHVLCFHAMDGNGTVIDFIEAHEQVDQCRLSGPGGADYGHILPGANVDGEILDDRLAGYIAEINMVEADGAGSRDKVIDLVGFRIHFRCFQEIEDTLGSGCAALHVRDGLGKLGQRLRKQLDISYEGDDDAERNLLALYKEGADDAYQQIAEIGYKLHQGHQDAAEELALPAVFIQ